MNGENGIKLGNICSGDERSIVSVLGDARRIAEIPRKDSEWFCFEGYKLLLLSDKWCGWIFSVDSVGVFRDLASDVLVF